MLYIWIRGSEMSGFKEKTSEINKKIGAMYIAMKRSDTPLYSKLACGLFVYYALSPLDLIPDFIPVLGALDDFIILPFLMRSPWYRLIRALTLTSRSFVE